VIPKREIAMENDATEKTIQTTTTRENGEEEDKGKQEEEDKGNAKMSSSSPSSSPSSLKKRKKDVSVKTPPPPPVEETKEEEEEEETQEEKEDEMDEDFHVRDVDATTPSRMHRPRNSAQKRKLEAFGDGVLNGAAVDEDDVEVPDDKEATMRDVRAAEEGGRVCSAETFDRNDPIEQLAELERFIKTSGGETPECLEGWSIYMTFRKHGASKGQPDLKIYPKDGFVAKDNTKDKAFYRSRLEVCRALGLQPAKPEKVPKKPKVPRVPAEKPLTKTQMMAKPTKLMSRKKAMESIVNGVAEREECEIDKVEHKTNEVGLRIVTLGTRGENGSEKSTKFLKDADGMIWADGYAAIWTYTKENGDTQSFRCLVNRDESASDELIESVVEEPIEGGDEEKKVEAAAVAATETVVVVPSSAETPLEERTEEKKEQPTPAVPTVTRKLVAHVGKARFVISEGQNILAESNSPTKAWTQFAKSIDPEIAAHLVDPFATKDFKVRVAFQAKFAKDIYDTLSSETLPFLQERYGIDEYKAILNREYLKQTRQLVFDLETSEYRRKITKERVTSAEKYDARFKEDQRDAEERACDIACAKLAANVVSNVVETGKRAKLAKDIADDEKKYEWDAERLAPKDAVRIERESNKERIGLSTTIRKIARSKKFEQERDRKAEQKEHDRKQRMLEKVKEEEEKRKKKQEEEEEKIKLKEKSQWLGGCFPKQEDEEDGKSIAPVEARVQSKVDSFLGEDDKHAVGFLLELFTFARRFRKVLFPGKGSADKFMPKSFKVFVDALKAKVPNEGTKRLIIGMLNPIIRDVRDSTDDNGAYALTKIAGPINEVLKEGGSTSKKTIEEIKEMLAEDDNPLKKQLALFDELLSRSFEALAAQHSAAPSYERQAFGCIAPEAADAFVNAFCRCRADPESFRNLTLDVQNKAGITNTYHGLRAAPHQYACRAPPALVVQSEVEAERGVEVETFVALNAKNDTEPERTKQRIVASEMCDMDKSSERVFLIRDALRYVSWDPIVKPGCKRGDIASAKGEIFLKDIASFDAKLESGIFAISAAINTRATSTGNPSKDEPNEDKEWLRLVKIEGKKVAEATEKTLSLESGKGKKLVASAIDGAIAKATKVGRDKFVAEIAIEEEGEEEKERMDVDGEEDDKLNKRELTRAVWEEGCQSCGMDMHEGGKGEVLLCDGCPREFHKSCLNPPVDENEKLPDTWFCPICVAKKNAIETSKTSCEMITPTSFTRVAEGSQLGEAAKKGTMFTNEMLKSKSLSKEARILLSQKLKRFAERFDADGWTSLALEDKIDALKILADLLLDTTDARDEIDNKAPEELKKKNQMLDEHRKSWAAYRKGENVGGGNFARVKTFSTDEEENKKITEYFDKTGEYPDSRLAWQKRFNQLEKSKRDNGVTRLEPIGGDRNNAAFWVLEDEELGKKEDSSAIIIAQAAGAGGGWGCNEDYNDDEEEDDEEEDGDAKRSLTPTTAKMRGSDALRVSEKEWMVLDADSVRETVIPGLNKRGYREGKLWQQLEKRFGAKKEGAEDERKEEKEEEEEKEITAWDVTEEHELIASKVDKKSLLKCTKESAKSLFLDILNDLPEMAYDAYDDPSRNSVVDTRTNAIRALATQPGSSENDAIPLATATLALELAISPSWLHESWGRFTRFSPVLRDASFPSIWFRLKNLKKAIKWNMAKRGGRAGGRFRPEDFTAVPDQRGARTKTKPNYKVDSSSDDDDAFHIKEGSKRVVGGEVIPAKKRRVFIEDTG